MYYTINLKDMINKLKGLPIWLYFVKVKGIVKAKYPKLDDKSTMKLTNAITANIIPLKDYKFLDGNEYLLHENV